MLHRIVLLACLLTGSFLGSVFAQTVDPCQYGCPKQGCPQCDEGGPIETDDESKDESGSDPQSPQQPE